MKFVLGLALSSVCVLTFSHSNERGTAIANAEAEKIVGSQCYSSSVQTFEICDGSTGGCGERSISSKRATSTGFSVEDVTLCCTEAVGGCSCSELTSKKKADGCTS